MKNLILIPLIFLNSISFSQNIFMQLENLFNELESQNDFNGNILIADKGESIFIKNYGVENEEHNTMLSNQSIFCLASITKQFTATGIVILKNIGKINYTDKLTKYYPELKHYGNITIHNLLTHTGGIPDYMSFMDEFWDKNKIATNNDVIRVLIKHNPKSHFQPNDKYEYSNTGYMLLASIIEKVSGITFSDFLRKYIFELVGMENTFIHSRRLNPKKMSNLTIGYSYSDSLNRRITPDEFGKDFFITYLDGTYGAGRLFSTTEDLLKWDRILYTERILSNADKKKMFSNYQLNDNKITDYGYGWMLEKNHEFGKIIYHSGRWGGYITYFERHLESDKTIIILQNMETDKTLVPIDRIRNIIYNKVKEVPIDILKQYAGKYLTTSGTSKEVFLENGKLYVSMSPTVKLELIPTSITKFIVEGFSPTVSYEFLKDDLGIVSGYRIKQEGTKLDQTLKKE